MYNKIVTAQEISDSEIANIMIGQPECYTNLQFVSLNYNSLYSEMLTMFPHLKWENRIEDEMEEMTVNILDRSTATDQFSDYRYRGETLVSLCLYDYKSIVYTTEASGIEKEQLGDMDSYAQFFKEYPLHHKMIQRIQ